MRVRIAPDKEAMITYCPPYLNPGKWYRAVPLEDEYNRYVIQDEDCFECIISLNNCSHLKGGNWEVEVEE